MSERNEQSGKEDRETIRARADLRYLARTSPPIPDTAMQEAHKLIELTRTAHDNDPAVAVDSFFGCQLGGIARR
jgi:hypothetical protein